MKYKWKEYLLNLFFPKRCAACDTVIRGGGICRECREKVRYLPDHICMKCGKKVKEGTVLCYDCDRKEHGFIRNFAVFEYGDIQKSLYRFKYGGRAEYAAYYAQAACERWEDKIKETGAEALVPVPLHASRRRKRGYNQAEELARELSVRTGIPVRTDLVKRAKKTKPLKMLNVSERQNNLKKAFLFTQNDVKLKAIIIVDDIYTTGTTLDAVSDVCHKAGISRIYGLTVAVGAGL